MSEETKLDERDCQVLRISNLIALGVYDPAFEETNWFTKIKPACEKAYEIPYILPNYALKPKIDNDSLHFEPIKQEIVKRGIILKIYEINVEMVQKFDEKLSLLLQSFKNIGDVQLIEDESIKSLIKVGKFNQNDLLLSSFANLRVSITEQNREQEETVVRFKDYFTRNFQYFRNNFGLNIALDSLNLFFGTYVGKEIGMQTEFARKLSSEHLVEKPIEYNFLRGSKEKLEYEVEADKYTKSALLYIPTFKRVTGNFDWDSPHEFLNNSTDLKQTHNLLVGD